eukprot:GGOE01002388.1.p1 GENE.GGOE01002388.1~~GGOE01002388.1.p1  ORF type:complete len:322 (+),score=51.75 GGOE01002388.1:157-1122(+)
MATSRGSNAEARDQQPLFLQRVCVVINSAEWWAGQVDAIMEQAGFPQGDSAMHPAKQAFHLVSSRGIDCLVAHVFFPIKTPLNNMVQNADQAIKHATQVEELLRERVLSLTPVVVPGLAGGLAPFHTALVSLVAARLLSHLYGGRVLPRRTLQRLLSAVLQLSGCLKDLPFMGPMACCSVQERNDLAKHVERELAKVQHVLAILEMPAELVVQQYCSLMDAPTPSGLTKLLQMRGASEADISTALEQGRRIGLGGESQATPISGHWAPRPGAVVVQGNFRGEHLATGLFRITGECSLTLNIRRETLFNKLWAIIVSVCSEQ